MDIRKEVIRKIANEYSIPEEDVEEIIAWTWLNVNKATTMHERIEISGIGDFVYNKRKAGHFSSKLQKAVVSLNGRKLTEAQKMIDYINKKDEQINGNTEADSKGNS